MLEKAGYHKDKIATVLAKCLVVAEDIIDDPNVDPFAKMAAIKMLVRDIAAVAPIKAARDQAPAQTPVVINIGDMPPAPARQARDVTPRPADTQMPVAIDGQHNAP